MTREEMWKEFEKQLIRETRTPITVSYDVSEKMTKSAIERTVVKWKERLEQEPRWIPVSERLPKEDIDCLVIDKDGEYGVGYYREDVNAWDSPNWGWLERKDRVDNKETFTEPCGIGKVVAWMPLPKPYREVEE